MDFGFSEEQEEFREEVRLFLKSQLEAGEFSTKCNGIFDRNQTISKKFAEKGWIGMTWSKQYGGGGRGYTNRIILMEECLKVQAPIGLHFMGDRQVGAGVPNLLAVDDIAVSILNGSGPNRHQIGAGIGFTEKEAEGCLGI